MDRDEYLEKMTYLLKDESTYKKLKKDPIKQISSKLNELVRSWRDGGIIEDVVYRRLNCTNGNLPRCYGLPKIHKNGFPLRIIVSALGSPLYNVASFLNEHLQSSIRTPESHIKDSWSFVKEINNIEIKADEVLVSLDVTALFTNIPKELVLKAIEKRWQDISKITKLSLPQFLHAIELVLKSTSFSFNGNTYEQIFGSPMGSPLSPVLADIVMEDLETHCLASLGFCLSFFRRYVDDVIAIIPKDKIGDVLAAFNNYHPRLKFTHEIEVNGAILFLDVLIIRNGNRLLTNWHRKPTFSGRYVNYFSNHPLRYKNNTIISLVDRAILLSDKQFHNSNIRTVRDILINNCFPEKFIDKQINKRLKELNYRKDIVDSGNAGSTFDARRHIVFPYVKGLSENIRRTVNRCGLEVLHTIPKKLDSIIKRGKDKLDNMKETGVVCKIDCNDCNVSYIGQTLRHLETRVKEHLSDIKKDESRRSVVSKHRLMNGHDFKWSTAEVLHREKNVRKREIAEMFYIKKHNNTINLKKDTENLNPLYDRIINAT
ncbi:uncharacterized protein [Temnothorax nylanderi]|uniref:uncharacterized protein n=1 Tax=Temnothorax nylanderi TaxID=102681 RepID=UPI003A856BBB